MRKVRIASPSFGPSSRPSGTLQQIRKPALLCLGLLTSSLIGLPPLSATEASDSLSSLSQAPLPEPVKIKAAPMPPARTETVNLPPALQAFPAQQPAPSAPAGDVRPAVMGPDTPVAPTQTVPAVVTTARSAMAWLLDYDENRGMPQSPYGELIYEVAKRYSLNPHLVAALIHAESAFNPRALSRKGACGLMQLLPATASRFGLGKKEIFEPSKNLEAGVRYLQWLSKRFNGDPVRVLAAYNAGEGAVERHGGVPPYQETQKYVRKILGLLNLDPEATLAAPATTMVAEAAKPATAPATAEAVTAR